MQHFVRDFIFLHSLDLKLCYSEIIFFWCSMQSAVTGHCFGAQQDSVQVSSYPMEFWAWFYHHCCLFTSHAAVTCCVAVQAGSWNRPNLAEKRDPFQLNLLCDLVQHWALQTSVPAGEWWARVALLLPSLSNFLGSVLSLLLSAAIFHSAQNKCNWLT